MPNVNDIQEVVKSTGPDAGGFNFIWSVFSVVPEQLLNEENPDLWLNFLRERIPRDQQIAQDPIPEQRCVCLIETRPTTEQRSHVIPFLIRACVRTGLADVVTAIRQGDKLAVAVLKDGHLQLANIYDSSTKEQTLYWLLSIYEQFHLPTGTPLYIQCGVSTRKLMDAHLNTFDLLLF